MNEKTSRRLEMLAQSWAQPPTGKGYVGFWSLNHVVVADRSDEQEFRWQLRQLHAKGMREVVVWLRAGHAIPYLSERWRSLVEIILNECKRLGMKAWFWDEDPFMQGTARGLTHEHLEYRGRLMISEVQTIQGGRPIQLALPLGLPNWVSGAATPPHPTDYGFPVAVQGVNKRTKQIVDLMDHVGTVHELWDVAHVVASAYLAPAETKDTIPYPRADKVLSRYALNWKPPAGTWDIVSFLINDGFYYTCTWMLDTINPDAVRAWIDRTHEWYWKHFKKHFGGALAGLYSAEPAHVRWTPRLWDYFQDMKGYDLRPLLPHLRLDIDERSPRIRIDYQEVHSELYAKNFTRQVRHWCEGHGIGYMGRFGLEERPGEMACTAGSVMPAIRELSVACSDLVNGLQIGDTNRPFISFGANLAYSMSRQKGNPTGFECLGPVDWQTSMGDSKAVTDWGFIIGADQVWLCNNMYSLDGYRKVDCPPGQFYQSPEWEYFDLMVKRYDRLAALARQGKEVRRVALIYPISSIFAHQSGFQPPHPYLGQYFATDVLRELETSLVESHQKLLEAHIPFDLLDETLLDTATIDARGLKVGEARYETLILPRCTHLPTTRCAALDRFTHRGGTLLVQRGPTIQAVTPMKNGGRLRPWKPARCVIVAGPQDAVKHKEVACHQVATLPRTVLARRWVGAGFEALALMNTDKEQVRLGWPAKGDGWQRWCLDSGRRAAAVGETIAGLEMAVFVKGDGLPAPEARLAPSPAPPAPPAFVLPLDGVWDLIGLTNCLMLERWGFLLGDNRPRPEDFSGKNFPSAYETKVGPLYKQVRFEDRPTFYDPATQVQLDRQPWCAPSSLPRWIYYRYFFTLHVDVSPDLSMLMESEGIDGDWRLWFNGHPISRRAFRFERVFDVGNRVAPLARYVNRGGFNEVIVAVRATRPSDGLQQPIRLLGDFRIEGHPRLTLAPTSPTILTGSWTTQGYPHASGRARYRRVIKLDPSLLKANRRWVLDCGEVADSCRAYVDGALVGTRLWKPFCFDLTAFVKASQFEVVVEVANNAGNIIAGESKSSGLIGPVRLMAHDNRPTGA